tara:strand:- start:671 stop:772 length:102 start_codon:yes stop_codon:yes gene_type:complete
MPVVREKVQAKNFATKIQPNKFMEKVLAKASLN